MLRRHDWAYLRDVAALAFADADDAVRAWTAQWLAAGRPLVATRQHAPEGRVALGIALPRERDSRRIACTAPASAVLRQRNPVTVEEAAEVLPAREAQALRRFAAALAGHALQLGVYGSTAWDFFAGGGYRHARSDVDVICDVASSAGLTACLAAFAAADRDFPSRLDGEIRFSGGRAVAWRELDEACRGGVPVVLAKGERDVALVALHHVLSPLR